MGNRDYVLTISAATLQDDAEYSVTARNAGGEAKSRAQLLVEPAPQGEKPRSDVSNSIGPLHGNCDFCM